MIFDLSVQKQRLKAVRQKRREKTREIEFAKNPNRANNMVSLISLSYWSDVKGPTVVIGTADLFENNESAEGDNQAKSDVEEEVRAPLKLKTKKSSTQKRPRAESDVSAERSSKRSKKK